MKKLLAIIAIIVLAMPAIVSADVTPSAGATISLSANWNLVALQSSESVRWRDIDVTINGQTINLTEAINTIKVARYAWLWDAGSQTYVITDMLGSGWWFPGLGYWIKVYP